MTRKALVSLLLDTANGYDENNSTAEANTLTKIAIKLAQDFEEEDFSSRPEYGPQIGFNKTHYGKYSKPPQFGWKGDKLEADDPDALDRLIEEYYSKWHPDLYESRVFHRYFDPANRKHHAFMSRGRGGD